MNNASVSLPYSLRPSLFFFLKKYNLVSNLVARLDNPVLEPH